MYASNHRGNEPNDDRERLTEAGHQPMRHDTDAGRSTLRK
jgi:hypothetical protein